MRAFFRRQSLNLTLLLVGLAIAASAYALTQENQAAQEACKIQQRGLAANDYLTKFLVTWDDLISVGQKPQAQKAFQREPKVQQQLTLEAIADLNGYATVERHQVKHRTCP